MFLSPPQNTLSSGEEGVPPQPAARLLARRVPSPSPAPCPLQKGGDPHPNPAPLQGGVSSIPGPCFIYFIFFLAQGGEHPSTLPLSKEAALLTCKADPPAQPLCEQEGALAAPGPPGAGRGRPQHGVPWQGARPPRCPSPSTYLVLEDRKASLINP